MTPNLPSIILPSQKAVLIDRSIANKEMWGPLKDSGSSASGIFLKQVLFQSLNPNIKSPKPSVIDYLNSLNYGPILAGGRKDVYEWDCADRSLWAIAHARRSYPGLPMAIAEGKGKVGAGIAGQDHAVVLLWWETDQNKHTTDYIYFDPSLPVADRVLTNKNDFGPIVRITAFPIAKRAAPNIIAPLDLATIDDDIVGHSITMDEYVNLYSMRTADKKGLLDYLEADAFSKSCVNSGNHSGATDNEIVMCYTDTDRALWNKAHIRRDYPGCPVAVAFGKPVDGVSKAVNIIWEGAGKKILWDPKKNPGPKPGEYKGGIVNDFKIEGSFM
jgi:hypothetical protein